MRSLTFTLLLLIGSTVWGGAWGGELPGPRGLPGGPAEASPVARIRQVADALLTEEVDVVKLAKTLGSREINRTEDKSPMRPNLQVYFAATEQFQVLRLSIERDKRWAAANPHSLYLTPVPYGSLSVLQMDQTFGSSRPGPSPHTLAWIYGAAGQTFVAQLIAEYPAAPTANSIMSKLQIRIDRR